MAEVEKPEAEYTERDGTRWVQVWRETVPGLLQLVWVIAEKPTTEGQA